MSSLYDKMIEAYENSVATGLDRSFTNQLFGLPHNNIRPPVKSSQDVAGFTFFTRPQLNLRTDNIKRIRHLYYLLNEDPVSMARYVRVILDPRLSYNLTSSRGDPNKIYVKEIVQCPLVDIYNPFIPILSNALISISGFPDINVPTFTTQPGIRKEQWSIIDGSFEIYETFDIDVTFKNYINDPILMLFQTWIEYASLVFEGLLMPYVDMIVENEIDYNTRIYRIILDPTWRYVKRISCTGASFPISVPTGKFFDYSIDRPYTDQTKEINIRFRCNGVIYNDPIVVSWFNRTVGIFNPSYRRFLNGENTMIPIPDDLLGILNFRGYPYIEPTTGRFLWLLPTTSKLVNRIKRKT